MGAGQGGVSVVVVSPHLDDAVLSIGGTIHSLTRRGADVVVATIFAGDPDSSSPASYWDCPRGNTQGEAVRQRRAENEAAVLELGASAVTLPWADSGYAAAREPDEIWAALGGLVQTADVTLLPGWPLSHADHRYATLLTLDRLGNGCPVGFYAEQPYASEPVTMIKAPIRHRNAVTLRHSYPGVRWRRRRLERTDVQAQARARGRYAGEIAKLGYRARWAHVHHRIGGEWLGFAGGFPLPPQFGVDGT
jgi:LmbE family N-acetylglucosaminyl deacetylase